MKSVLKRNIGLCGGILLVLGNVIGAGVFFKPYAIYNATGGAPGVGIISWLSGGIITLFAALTFAELASLYPETGGMTNYLSHTYGEVTGFLSGFMQIVIFYPAFIAGYALCIAKELSEYLGNFHALPVALFFIIFLTFMNALGRNAFKTQAIFTLLKIALLVFFILGGFIKGNETGVFTPFISKNKNILFSLNATLLAVLFTFEGWTNIGAIAGEMKNPGKDLPRAIIAGVFLIMLLYVAINISYLHVLPAKELMLTPSPASKVALKIFGPLGKTFVKTGIILSVIGAANGFLITGSRVLYAMSLKKLFPLGQLWCYLNENNVPCFSIYLIGFLSCIYVFSGSFDYLTDLATFSSWIFYTLTFYAVIRLRKTKPEIKRIYKVPFYPFVPLMAVASGAYVLLNQLFSANLKARKLAFLSLGITLSGLPFYYIKKIKGVSAFYFKKSPSKSSILLKNSKDSAVL